MLENISKIGAVGDGSDYSRIDDVGTDSGAPVEAPATEVAPELSPEADELVTRSLPLGDIDLDEVRRARAEAATGGLGSSSAASPSSSGPSAGPGAASAPPHGPSGGGPGTGGPGSGGPGTGGPSIPPHGPGGGGPGSPSAASPSSGGPGAASGPAFVPGPTVFDPLTKFVKEGHFIYREQSARNCIMSAGSILKDNGLTPSVGNLLTLYLARNTEEFQTGNIKGTDTTMGALDKGRLEGLNAYIQSEYKSNMVRELGSIRRSYGTVEVEDFENICGRIEIVPKYNASGEIERTKGGYVKTQVDTSDELIKGILTGEATSELRAIKDDKGKVVEWELSNGHKLTEDGRKSIAAKIIGAHYDGSTALEHKGDKLIESVAPWREGMQPHELKRFQMAFKGAVTEDGLIRSRFDSLMGDFWKIFETAVRKGG